MEAAEQADRPAQHQMHQRITEVTKDRPKENKINYFFIGQISDSTTIGANVVLKTTIDTSSSPFLNLFLSYRLSSNSVASVSFLACWHRCNFFDGTKWKMPRYL